ncbi:PREDICTED: uncharacterized protein LOC108559077 isoform X2 [Nicrophorus vespilloides]|nr:PREDICTED: uncharacterized protein LOC108559077 isoform X2 [Nicrophorus vespilloides]
MSDIICGENFNTLKKGPHWSETKTSPIEPPLEFQDKPNVYETFAEGLVVTILQEALLFAQHSFPQIKLNPFNLQVFRPIHQVLHRSYWSPDFLPFSPCHGGRPSSRSSLGSSRLSSSHNSLSVPTAHRADDSSFITQAVSHDTLSSNQISDLYNVPFDSDVYAIPVDTVRPPLRPRRIINKKRRRNTSSSFRDLEKHTVKPSKTKTFKPQLVCTNDSGKRHSVAGTSTTTTEAEPIHMTLQEVRQYLQTLYSSSSDSSEHKDKSTKVRQAALNNNKYSENIVKTATQRNKKNFFNIKNKKVKGSYDNLSLNKQQIELAKPEKRKKSPAKIFSLKQTLCNMFRFRRILSPEHVKPEKTNSEEDFNYTENLDTKNISKRALPPLPPRTKKVQDVPILDFATSIRKVKDYGWYWGPLSSEAAEKILSNEPDGSFIVRDSSDDHYIFSLTFKLNNSVRHVRIEHDQGNFSFGSCTKFKSQTIVDFIENAVEHSRSGRYLFFLHRRPTIGPVRVQLLHPVSRFKQIQSLQHMCRFVILKKVRKDLISGLPLPRRMIDYLSTPHYYSENLIDIDELSESEHMRRENPDSEEYSDDATLLNMRQS